MESINSDFKSLYTQAVAKVKPKSDEFRNSMVKAVENLTNIILIDVDKKIKSAIERGYTRTTIYTYNPRNIIGQDFTLDFLINGSKRDGLGIFKKYDVIPVVERVHSIIAPFRVVNVRKWPDRVDLKVEWTKYE